jgi:hypothetical protein
MTPKLVESHKIFQAHSKNVIKVLKTEMILTQCLMRPCSAHYFLDGPNYLPYLKYWSRRAVVEGHFVTRGCINELK